MQRWALGSPKEEVQRENWGGWAIPYTCRGCRYEVIGLTGRLGEGGKWCTKLKKKNFYSKRKRKGIGILNEKRGIHWVIGKCILLPSYIYIYTNRIITWYNIRDSSTIKKDYMITIFILDKKGFLKPKLGLEPNILKHMYNWISMNNGYIMNRNICIQQNITHSCMKFNQRAWRVSWISLHFLRIRCMHVLILLTIGSSVFMWCCGLKVVLRCLYRELWEHCPWM